MKNNGRASVYSMATGTSAMKMPRHNVNESLKKKLGIANCRAVAAPLPSPAVTTPTHSSPMISGVKGRSKRQTTPKQLEFPDPIRSADCSRTTGRTARTTPKQKNAKRESKKTVQPVTNNTNNNKISREMDVQTIPEELWFGPCQSQDDALSALHMQTWFIPELCATVPASITTTLASAACPPFLHLSRDERLELKRSELRRRTIQVRNAQQHREIVTARRRFLYVQSVLMQEETDSHEQTTMIPDSVFSEELRLCRVDGCQDEPLVFTAFCPVHVTGSHDEQLFAPCSVRFADKSQCSRVPVFDESHETPFCREHAAAAGREKDSRQLPRLTTERVVTGKAVATGGGGGSAPAKNKKKSRSNNSSKRSTVPGKASAMPKVDLTPSLPRKSVYLNHHHQNGGGEAVPVVVNVQPTQLQPAPQQQKQTNLKIRRPEIVTRFAKVGSQAVHKMLVKEEQYDFVDEEDSVGLEEDVVEEEEEDDSLLQPRSKKSSPFAVKRKSYRANYGAAPMTTATNQTDLLLVSENSSAYESSEDTGVGGLSESEMIGEFVLFAFQGNFFIYSTFCFQRKSALTVSFWRTRSSTMSWRICWQVSESRFIFILELNEVYFYVS